ncbi:MAG TPA: beta-ketoacyl-[acyl-carrier-protein] synthase family protein [Planctomycetota bacterium]|nr:beta-ketoacyl-[acyl-carrier-protein] synthase family protein [Planctomycetota bacterium]
MLLGGTRRRVVVTGMDALSCLGATLPAIEASLRAGTSGIGVSQERIDLGFRSPLTGVIPAIDPTAHFARKERKTMGETALYAAITAKNAIRMSGCAEALKSDRAGLLFGNDSCADPIEEILTTVRSEKSTGSLGSDKVIKALNSTPTINLGPAYGMRGINLTVSGACASGAHAIGLGWMMITSGLQDIVVCGGSQELCWQSMAAFDGLRVFSMRIDTPHQAVRPFDRDRDGLVPSGGAACLVIEDYEHAVARGATILAEIASYAFSSDGDHMTTGDGRGAARCMREALDRAGVAPGGIDYINAHATATEAGDAAEAAAIASVFGERTPPVSSTKSLTGHECWMAGASEALYSILMLRGGFIAPNANFENHDPKLPRLDIVAKPRLGVKLTTVLSNSFGFGGTNACLVIKAVGS